MGQTMLFGSEEKTPFPDDIDYNKELLKDRRD